MTPTTPTPGAMRAAQQIRASFDSVTGSRIERIAAIIDRETGLAELTAALNEIVAICDAGVIQRSETGKPQWHALDAMKDIARAALARAKG